MEDSGSQFSRLSEVIDPTNCLALLVEDPKLLYDDDVVCRNEIQPSSTEGCRGHEGARGLDFEELLDQLAAIGEAHAGMINE